METFVLIYVAVLMTLGLAFIIYGGVYIWRKLDSVIEDIKADLNRKTEN